VPEPTRLRARLLRAAIDDFAHTTAGLFHGGGARTTRDLLTRYAHDHLREPGGGIPTPLGQRLHGLAPRR